MANDLGELRRSAVVTTFGPGAIVDFRADDAPVSAVAAGLEEWDRAFPPAGILHPQTIREPRLQKKLGVQGFRLPPVQVDAREGEQKRSLVAVRFPTWLQCPQCDRVGPERLWADEPGKAYRYCPDCTAKSPARSRVHVVPVRFVMACENGHLDEFPWHWWVQHAEDCRDKKGFLKLASEKPGLIGLVLSCPACRARKSMGEVFSKRTWSRFQCQGLRPWLAGADEKGCRCEPRALQRGASNLYFPVIESALSIPPWSDRLQEALGIYWDSIVDVEPDQRVQHVRFLAGSVLRSVLEELHLTPEQLVQRVEERIGSYRALNTDDLRAEEYRQFMSGFQALSDDREFEIRPVAVPDTLRRWFSAIVKVVRLREVRAIRGFTRIQPADDSDAPTVAPISASPQPWLPAIEVRGEGIFLALDEEELERWEKESVVRERAERVHANWAAEWNSRYGEAPARVITPRLLLIHSLAHALMRQLTLDCGYSSSALRERLYVRTGEGTMAGLLVYTATSDADGTLGGLQRQGDPERIERTIIAAVQSMQWCSSDPLCIEDMLVPDGGLSLAACHACVLAPETSCEEHNRFLDRALLVGTPEHPEAGYFRNLLPEDRT